MHHIYTARHTSNLISGFFWLKQLRIMAKAAETLGKTADAQKWKTMAEKGASSFNKSLLESDGMYRDIGVLMQQGATNHAT